MILIWYHYKSLYVKKIMHLMAKIIIYSHPPVIERIKSAELYLNH